MALHGLFLWFSGKNHQATSICPFLAETVKDPLSLFIFAKPDFKCNRGVRQDLEFTSTGTTPFPVVFFPFTSSVELLKCAYVIEPIGAISISYWKSRDNQVDPHWRDEVFYDCGELENKPEVTVDALYRSGAKVTLSNTGHTTLCYSG